jgi:hypothetical protein
VLKPPHVSFQPAREPPTRARNADLDIFFRTVAETTFFFWQAAGISGGVNLSPESVAEAALVHARRGEMFGGAWAETTAIQIAMSGETLALGADGVYLMTIDGLYRPFRLSPDLFSFLDGWSRLAFVGPERHLLNPFLERSGMNPDGAHAQRLRNSLGLPDDF